MSTVNVTVSTANVTASSTNANITVAQTNSVITVSNVATLSNANVVRNAISVTDAGGDGSLSYNSGSGVITYTGPSQAEVLAHFSNVSPVKLESNGQISVDSSALFSGKTTDDLAEGSTNFYFTNARANTAIDARINAGDGIDITSGTVAVDSSVVRLTGSQVLRDKIMSNVTANANLFAQNNVAFGAEWVDGSGGAGEPNGSLLLGQANDVADTVYRRNFIALGGGLTVTDTANAHLKNQYANVRIGSKREVQVYLDPYYVQGDTRKFIVGERTSLANTSLKPLLTVDTANSNVIVDGNFNTNTFSVTGNIDTTANINAGFFHGDGSNITNVSQLTNAQVKTFIESSGLSASANLTTTANISAGNVIATSNAISPLFKGNVDATTINVSTFAVSGTKPDALTVNGNTEVTGQVSVIGPIFTQNQNNVTVDGNLIVQQHSYLAGTNVTVLNATANITTLTGNIQGQTGKFLGATSITASGNVSIGGNLDVTGNINSETVVDLFVEDRNITLQYGAVGTPSANSQLFVDRGDESNTYILWDEVANSWKFSNDGSTDYLLPSSTSDLAEGTNLYFTAARARGNISVTDSGGDGSLAYDSGTGVITYTGPSAAEVRAHISATANIFYNSTTGVISEDLKTQDITEGDNLYYTQARFDTAFGNKTTSDLTEGTNLYYTTDRANTAINNYTGTFANAVINTTQDITTSGFFEGDLNGAVTADVYNNTGSTLTKGQAVYLTGGNNGDNPHVALADADDATKMPALGIVRENITNASVGQVVTSGVINFTSHGFTAGADLFISTTAGNLSETAPTGESGLIQKIGKVISSSHIIVQGAFRTNATPNLNEGNIFLGSTSGTTIPVTPQNNFVTTANAFNLSNALTGVKSITSESSGDLDLIVDNSTGYVSLNREIDSVDTAGLEVDAKGFALKGLTPFNGFSASGTAPANVTGMVCTAVGPGTVTFTAGSNVVQITGIYAEAVFNGGSGTQDLADYYGNGMVFANFGITDSGNGNSNRPVTYPLSESHKTISLANSTAGGTANVIVDEVSPIDYVWTGNNLWDRGLWHTVENSTSNRRLIVGGALTSSFTTVTNAIPVDRNDYYVNDTGTNSTTEFDTSSVTGMTGANVTLSGFSTAFYSSAQRRYKKTSLRSTKGSTNFSNVVLIGNDAQYDDSGFGYNYWPTFGMTTLWNGTDTPGNDTGAAQSPPITPGLKFIQFTDQTIQGSGSSNAEEASTGGPRILLNSSNGNISLNVAEYYPRQNQGLGVFGVYGSSKTNPFPRTRSMLPGGMYFTASEDWEANTGTDAYFVSTPKLTVGTDTDANAAKMFMASNNGETSLMGTSKVSFYTSGNAYASGNIVGGYNAIKAGTEWANISSTGIQTAGTIAGATTTLKKFNETVVALGSVSGDQSSALNATNGSIYTLTATGGITINTIANAVAGTSMTIVITQDGTGSHALTSSMKFVGGSKTLSTAANAIDVISVVYDGTNYLASLTKAYA